MSKPSVRHQRTARLAADIAEVEHSITRCTTGLTRRLQELEAAGLAESDPATGITDRTAARYRQQLKLHQQRLNHLRKRAQFT